MNRDALFRSLIAILTFVGSGLHAGDKAESKDRPFSLSGTYTIEILGNVSGGKHTGAVSDGLLQLALDVHPESFTGWSGMTIHGGLAYAHGPSLTDKYVGDFAVASNIDAYDTLRLAEAWIEQSAFHDRVSLRAGVLVMDTEFCLSEMSEPFINSTFGLPTTVSENFALADYPFSAPGLRLRIKPAAGWNLLLGAFDGNVAPGVFPDPTPGAAPSTEFNHWSTHLALRRDEGALLLAELGWQSDAPDDNKEEVAPLGGMVKAGAIYHTDRFARIGDSTLAELGTLDSSAEASGVRGNYAVYLFADHELWREPGSSHDGLGAFIHGAFAPPGRNFFRYSLATGLVYRGLFQEEAGDTMGLGLSWVGISPDVREAYRTAQAQSPRDEVIVELTYQRTLTKWCTLQPDLQYIVNPGGFADHALVVGMRVVLNY